MIALLVVGVSSLFASPRGTVEKAFTKTTAAFEEAGDKLGMPDLAKLQKDRSISGSFRVELTGISSQLVGYDLSDLYGLGLGMRTNYSGKDRKMDAQLSAFWDDDELVSFQMLADNANLYLGSSQFTDGSFYGLNTETLGADLKKLSGDDSVEDISFNLFDLMDIILKAAPGEESEKAVKEANKALKAALEVKKTGAKTMDIHGKSTKTTAYHVVIPQDALEDYVDAMAPAVESPGVPSWTTTYSGMTTRLNTISPLSSIGLISASAILGGKFPNNVLAGITIFFSSSSDTSKGSILTFCKDNSPENTSTPSILTG